MTAFLGLVRRRPDPTASVTLGDAAAEVIEPFGDSTAGVNVSVPPAAVVARFRGERSQSVAERRDPHGELVTAVVADARLDDRRNLAAAVGLPASAGDAELLLGAYERWGRDFPEHVYGDLAVVVVDRRRAGVMLVRDHAGHRPLAVHVDDERVVFGSTALSLTTLEGVAHEIDLDRMVELAVLAYGRQISVIRGVRFVDPGAAMWIDAESVTSWRWWRPEAIGIVDRGSLAAQADHLRGLLDTAVADMTDGQERVGVMLSGGLDSTAVAASLADLRAPQTVQTYTSVPPVGWEGEVGRNRDADERHLVADLVERYPNLSSTLITAEGRDLLADHLALWELGSLPARNASNLLWVHALWQEAAADGVSLLLTGQSGNRVFSADGPRALVELARRGRLLRMFGEARAWARATDKPLAQVLRNDLVALAAPRSLRRWRRRRSGTDLDRAADWMKANAANPERRDRVDIDTVLPTLRYLDTTGWTRWSDDLFMVGAGQAEFRFASATWWGVEMADPTAERRLIEGGLTQPEWWRRHGGVSRAIVRAAMRDRLPSSINDRTRRGAQLPDWFDRLTEQREQLEAEVEAAHDHPASREVLDTDRLRTLVRNWPDREVPSSRQTVYDYNLALTRALVLSKYLQWFDERGRRIRTGGPQVVLPLTP